MISDTHDTLATILPAVAKVKKLFKFKDNYLDSETITKAKHVLASLKKCKAKMWLKTQLTGSLGH